jgi:glycosyltransferase involved in cell wall biosynthesis
MAIEAPTEQRALPLLSVIILTLDEEVNLPICLDSLCGLDAEVFVVDSGSSDRTTAIAREFGARVVPHKFENQARQVNWALDNLLLRSPWTLRLDADERLTPQLAAELRTALPSAPGSATGFLVKRRVYFWGRWIKHGGYYPTWLLRIWRTGKGRCEDVWMDEHVVVEDGEVRRLQGDIVDENHKGLAFWIDKHNGFSDREVRSIMTAGARVGPGRIGRQAARKRFLKQNIYHRAPRIARAILYWSYRYFLLLGFLDGKEGFVFHFLQGFWYRVVVDAKLYEAERNAGAAKPAAVSDRRFRAEGS